MKDIFESRKNRPGADAFEAWIYKKLDNNKYEQDEAVRVISKRAKEIELIDKREEECEDEDDVSVQFALSGLSRIQADGVTYIQYFVEKCVNIYYNNSTIVKKEKSVWYKHKNDFVWPAYKKYLLDKKKFKREVVDSIDQSTTQILNSFTDPKSDLKEIKEKGLVIGDVQSGKTANFMGLIAKSCDEDFDFIVVLSGRTDSLRKQTLSRIEKEIIGRQGNKNVGISEYFDDMSYNPKVKMISKIEQDFTPIQREDIHVNKPKETTYIYVVKKNTNILQNLDKQFSNLGDFSILVIDDEADEASINTKNEDEITKTNGLIRGILSKFNKNYYVSYTATPVANLMIRKDSKSDLGYDDLFPKDFIMKLESGEEYTGYSDYFNSDNLVVESNFSKKEKIIEESLFDYVLSAATKSILFEDGKVRDNHSSMIIHLSHTTSEHEDIREKTQRIYDYNIAAKILGIDKKELMEQFYKLYIGKKISTYYSIDFDVIFSRLCKMVNEELFSIVVLNSDTGSELKYDEGFKNNIIIGGNKISRGLTIEGLLTTVYDRNAKDADTSLQMARWYGYRNDYLNLTRLYLSKETILKFNEIEEINEEISEVVMELEKENLTPLDFTIELTRKDHVQLTSRSKSKNSKSSPNDYSESSPQITKVNVTKFDETMRSIEKEMENVDFVFSKNSIKYEKVNSEKIIKLLNNYDSINNTTKEINKNSRSSVSNWEQYINTKNVINELVDWTVVIVGKGEKEKTIKYSGIELNMIRRASMDNNGDYRRFKIVSQPENEFLDLKYEMNSDGAPKRSVAREMRDPSNGLMVIYPLYSETDGGEFKGVSLMISFPKTEDYQDLDKSKIINN